MNTLLDISKLIARSLLLVCIILSFSSISDAQISLQLSASNYNGYNISCFGEKDGIIDLTISGGVPPYTILWSTNDSIEDLTQLPAGYYIVRVIDSDTIPQFADADITLKEPLKLDMDVDIHKYQNKYNISVYGACNGIVNLTLNGGVSPYVFLWNDNNSLQTRTAMCAEKYEVRVTDLNGCKSKAAMMLTQPDRSDWQIGGNIGIDPNLNYLGTSDSSDLVFKTNNDERLRITSNGNTIIDGELIVNESIYLENKLLFGYQFAQDSLKEILSFGGRPYNIPNSVNCNTPQLVPVNQFTGYVQTFGFTDPQLNDVGIVEMGFDGSNGLIESYGASTDPNKNRLLINYYCGNDVFVGNSGSSSSPAKGTLTANHNLYVLGQVGIGTTDVQPGYKLVVDGGKVGFREAYVKLIGLWPDYVFSENYKLMPLNSVEEFFSTHKRLPGMPTSKEIENEGQNLGEIQRLQQEKIEELYLYILDLNKKLEQLLVENQKSKQSR